MQTHSLRKQFDRLDSAITHWMARHGITLLRVSVGIIYLWFGALKLVPGLSPAEGLIRASLTFLPMDLFIPFLAVWEIAIGLGFITGKFMRATILLMLGQMAGAASPIVLKPDWVFTIFPFVLTLEGQYIIKNLVLIGASIVVGATVRGGGLSDRPLQSTDQGDL